METPRFLATSFGGTPLARSFLADSILLSVIFGLILWNTVYLDRSIQALRASGKDIDEALLPHLSPLGWEHINLTGDYIWRQNKQVEQGKFRPLRESREA